MRLVCDLSAPRRRFVNLIRHARVLRLPRSWMSARLANEPARLQAEQHRLKSEIATAAVEHYPALVEAADRANTVATIAHEAARTASTTIGALHKLQQESVTLSTAGAHWRKEQRRAVTALSSHARVAELLDAPATLETCVRSDMYHEARLLMDHVATLADAMPESKLMQTIADDVFAAAHRLTAAVVVPKLGSSLTVSTALKLTTFLRHMGVEQAPLEEAFLILRAEFIDSLILESQQLNVGMPASFLNRVLVIWKVQVADTIAMFSGCFGHTSTAALAKWSLDRTGQLRDLWRTHLREVASSTDIASLADQVAQCSASWTALGFDVAPLLFDTIAERVAMMFAAHMTTGLESFLVALGSHTWKATSPASAGTSAESDELTPPMSLVQVLPLAYVAHSVVAACNDIRKCAATASWPRCVAAVEDFLERVVAELSSLRDNVASDEAESEAVQSLVGITTADCLPFVCRCVDRVFDREHLTVEVLPRLLKRFSDSTS